MSKQFTPEKAKQIGDKIGVDWKKIDLEQFRMGLAVELEHGSLWGDGTNDGRVNDYRAAATNQAANHIVYFGNWEDVVMGLWGGLDIVVNPYTRDTDAVVRITVNTWGDLAVRHAASFAVSSDSGAQ